MGVGAGISFLFKEKTQVNILGAREEAASSGTGSSSVVGGGEVADPAAS